MPQAEADQTNDPPGAWPSSASEPHSDRPHDTDNPQPDGSGHWMGEVFGGQRIAIKAGGWLKRRWRLLVLAAAVAALAVMAVKGAQEIASEDNPGDGIQAPPGSSNPADADRSQAQEAAAGAFWSTLAVHAPNNDADALTRWCADGRRCAQSVLGFADRLCAVGAGLAEGAQARAMQSASDVMTPYGEAAEWVSVAARLGWNSAARDMAMAAALTRCDPGGGPN